VSRRLRKILKGVLDGQVRTSRMMFYPKGSELSVSIGTFLRALMYRKIKIPFLLGRMEPSIFGGAAVFKIPCCRLLDYRLTS